MRKLATLLIVLTASSALNPIAMADDRGPISLKVNPETIRHQLLEGNVNVRKAMIRVHGAKDQVNIARAKLLPSINLGGLLTFTTGPTFVFSTAEALLSFLLPSTWFDLAAQKDLFESEKISYRLLELNTYGSALSLYFTVLSDYENQRLYESEANDLKQISDIILRQVHFGVLQPEDGQRAYGQAQLALARASRMREMSLQELAALRQALGLELQDEMILDSGSMKDSEWENKPIDQAITQALTVAPEVVQLDHLIKAAENQTWSQAFGFFDGFTVAAQQPKSDDNTPQNVSFSKLAVKGSVNLGFAMIPSLEFSNRNTEELALRKTELHQDTTRILEAAVKSLVEAKRQLELAQSAESAMSEVYRIALRKYQLGVTGTTILDVLTARTQTTDSAVTRVQAKLDVDLLRTTLHRTMLTDQFGEIHGCDTSNLPKEEGGFWSWLGGLLSGETHAKLEEVCREGGAVVPES